MRVRGEQRRDQIGVGRGICGLAESASCPLVAANSSTRCIMSRSRSGCRCGLGRSSRSESSGTSAAHCARRWHRSWSSANGRSRGGPVSDSRSARRTPGKPGPCPCRPGSAAVADRDTGRLLATVLEGIQPEVGELGDVLSGGPDSEDTAGILGSSSCGSRSWVKSPSPRGTAAVYAGVPDRAARTGSAV